MVLTWLIAGKSSLTVQFVEGHFVDVYYPTIENSFSHEIAYKGQTYLTEIIDTQGQVSLSTHSVCYALQIKEEG